MVYYIFCYCQTDYIILEELNDIFIFLYKTSIEELIYDEGKTSVNVYEWLEGSLTPNFEMRGLEYNLDEDTFICCQTEAFSSKFCQGIYKYKDLIPNTKKYDYIVREFEGEQSSVKAWLTPYGGEPLPSPFFISL
jgi:hypothetical protein